MSDVVTVTMPFAHKNDLEPHQQRVVNEAVDLGLKTEKLQGFFSSEIFSGLAEAEQQRLREQFGHMSKYFEVLLKRIEAF